jgi:hypothetical protein
VFVVSLNLLDDAGVNRFDGGERPRAVVGSKLGARVYDGGGFGPEDGKLAGGEQDESQNNDEERPTQGAPQFGKEYVAINFAGQPGE